MDFNWCKKSEPERKIVSLWMPSNPLQMEVKLFGRKIDRMNCIIFNGPFKQFIEKH